MAISNKTKKTEAKPANLGYKSFVSPDDLCDFINDNKIKPFSINVTDRFYIVFYFKN